MVFETLSKCSKVYLHSPFYIKGQELWSDLGAYKKRRLLVAVDYLYKEVMCWISRTVVYVYLTSNR